MTDSSLYEFNIWQALALDRPPERGREHGAALEQARQKKVQRYKLHRHRRIRLRRYLQHKRIQRLFDELYVALRQILASSFSQWRTNSNLRRNEKALEMERQLMQDEELGAEHERARRIKKAEQNRRCKSNAKKNAKLAAEIAAQKAADRQRAAEAAREQARRDEADRGIKSAIAIANSLWSRGKLKEARERLATANKRHFEAASIDVREAARGLRAEWGASEGGNPQTMPKPKPKPRPESESQIDWNDPRVKALGRTDKIRLRNGELLMTLPPIAAQGANDWRGGQDDDPAPPPTSPATPVALASLAGTSLSTPQLAESTLGGMTSCLICFGDAKSHAAVPCGHQILCAECAAKMAPNAPCPSCRQPVAMWIHVRVL